MATILVDYENVQGFQGLKGVEYLNENDHLIIFYSATCMKIAAEYMDPIRESGCQFSIYKLKTARKNALDFYIATESGRLSAMGNCQIALITRDKGFDSISDFFSVNENLRTTKLVVCDNVEHGLEKLTDPEDIERRRLIRQKMQTVDLEIEYGKVPVYEGETPKKTSTAKYDYSFSSWSPALTKVTDEATYTALFDSTLRSYEVSFVSEGETLLAKEYEYGTLPKFEGNEPLKKESKGFTYSFKGWNPSVAMVKDKAVYTAVFDSVAKTFVVTFMNGKDTLQSTAVSYGNTPEYKGKTPTKTSSDKYEFNLASAEFYDFTWNTFCDYYIEMAKYSLDDEATKSVLCFVLTGILKMLHPFMPFVTEEIYGMLPVKDAESIMISEYPKYDKKLVFTDVETAVDDAVEFIKNYRYVKAENNISKDAKVMFDTNDDNELIVKMLKIKDNLVNEPLGIKAYKVFSNRVKATIYFERIETEADKALKEQQIKDLKNSIARREKLLSNENYVNKAPANIVEQDRQKLAEEKKKLEELTK